MNAVWLDTLARAVSRRQVLRLVGGGLRRAVLGRVLTATAVGTVTLRPDAAEAQQSSCEIEKIRLWLNAFIPRDVPGVTVSVPGGPYVGQTMLRWIPGLPSMSIGLSDLVFDCFLTDNRDVDRSPAASSRMHSEIEIDVRAGTYLVKHVVGETIEVECDTGEYDGTDTEPNDRMEFSNFRVETGLAGQRVFKVDLKGAGANPRFAWQVPGGLICDIDYKGTFTVELAQTRDEATVTFEGWVDAFPAYEGYAAADGGEGQELFTNKPASGKSPTDLCDSPASLVKEDWHPTVPVGGHTTLRCDPGVSALYQFESSLPDAGANGVRCGDRPCTSGLLSFRLEIAPAGRVTGAQVDIEVAREVQPEEECGVSGWEFHGQELYEFGWGPNIDPEGLLANLDSDPSLYVAVVGSVTEYYAGPKCDPAQPFGHADVWALPFFLNLVDARTLALCSDFAFTRAECLASPVALLTGPEPLIPEEPLA